MNEQIHVQTYIHIYIYIITAPMRIPHYPRLPMVDVLPPIDRGVYVDCCCRTTGYSLLPTL